MWHRPLRRVDIRESWRRAKQAFASVTLENASLTRDNEELRQQLAEAEATIRQMQAATMARYEAWSELTALHRERQLELARRTERTLETTLH